MMKIGFFKLNVTSKDAYIGSVLITDEDGLPLEYKLTSAIEPTPIQRALYGTTLERYIAVEMCGEKLYSYIEKKPDMIFVIQDFCADLGKNVKRAIVYIVSKDKKISLDTITIMYDTGCNLNLGFNQDLSKEDIDELTLSIRDLNQSFDLLKVFQRIDNAVQVAGHSIKS